MHERHLQPAVLWIASTLSLVAASACGGTSQQAPGYTPYPPGAVAGSGVTTPPSVPVTPPITPIGAGGAGAAPVTPTTPVTNVPVAGTPAVAAAAGTAAPPTGVVPTGPVTTNPATPVAAPGTSPDSLYDAASGVLRAPATADGFQVTTSMFMLAPGDEKFTCYHAEIPADGEIDIRYWESKMAQGSHHFILYKTDGDTVPAGTMDQSGCTTGFTNWIYSSAQPHIDLAMPANVAMVLGARQRVQFDMHYINSSDKTLPVQVQLNGTFAKGTFEKAASLISYNAGIFLQPHAAGSASGDCTPGAGAKFFYMLTHTHRRGTLATISRVLSGGKMGEELVKSTDWELPQEKKWLTAPYLTFQSGELIHYDCEYMNDLDQLVTAGPSATTNEMCMAITYYFPASAGGSCR
jgi:Copper type II ascorbate-dependent monooxygenase, C-terminal domain